MPHIGFMSTATATRNRHVIAVDSTPVSLGRDSAIVSDIVRTKKANRTDRLDARVSRDEKSLFKAAARARGFATVTAYVLATLRRDAERVLAEQRRMDLDAESSRRFVEALLAADAPNEALRAAAARHRELVRG